MKLIIHGARRANEKITFEAPADVLVHMHEPVNQTNAGLKARCRQLPDAPHPVILAARFHVEFVSIHPFFDGNGRMARLFTNLILIQCGLPPVIIPDVHKQAYDQLPGDIQAYGGTPDLFHHFLASRVPESLAVVWEELGKWRHSPVGGGLGYGGVFNRPFNKLCQGKISWLLNLIQRNGNETVITNDNFIDQYEKTATQVFERILENQQYIRALTHLRDTRLPRLVSGQFEVANV